MVGKGSNFEKLTKSFVRELFGLMGFKVLKVRKQWAGTQYGFDIHVIFLDNYEMQKEICLECKDYSKDVEWKEMIDKIVQVNASPYNPDAFIGLSPKSNISNVNDASFKGLKNTVKFPIELWCPDSKVDEIFALYPEIYKEIYKKDPPLIDKNAKIEELKSRINSIIATKVMMNCFKKIEIRDADKSPEEAPNFVTNLDRKLNAILKEDDPDRLEYHKFRCDYKVFIQELGDLDNDLRSKILNWQNDLRIKANRLTKKFNSFGQSSNRFFYDFFDEAEKSMNVFISENSLKVSEREKLLNGVVFELAAECPLDWVKKNG